MADAQSRRDETASGEMGSSSHSSKRSSCSVRVCWALTHLIVELMHISTCLGVYNLFADYWDAGMIGDLLAQIRTACDNGSNGDGGATLNNRMCAAQVAGLVDLATGTALPEQFDAAQAQSQQLCIVYQALDSAVRVVALGPIPTVMTATAILGCLMLACLPNGGTKSSWGYTVLVSIALAGQLHGYYAVYDATWEGDDSICTFFGWNCDTGPACPDATGCPTGSAYGDSDCVPPDSPEPPPSVPDASPPQSPPPPERYICSSLHCASCRREGACTQQGGCTWSTAMNGVGTTRGAEAALCLQPAVPCLKDWKTLKDNMPRPPGTLAVHVSDQHHDPGTCGDVGRRRLRLGSSSRTGDDAGPTVGARGDLCGTSHCEECTTRTACTLHAVMCEWRVEGSAARSSCASRNHTARVSPPQPHSHMGLGGLNSESDDQSLVTTAVAINEATAMADQNCVPADQVRKPQVCCRRNG